jgi:molybdenum cofactor cytidylyltransferase
MLVSVVLLAGNSSRMGEPKQHVKLQEMTFLEHIIQKLELNKKSFEKMIFVGQKKDEKSKNLIQSKNGTWIINERPEDGPLSSIKLALSSLPEPKPILLWPIDHPLVSAQTLEKLIEIWHQDKTKIAVPSDGERRGHPTIFPKWAQEKFFEADMKVGAKQILSENPEKIQYLLVNDPWIRANINNKEILNKAMATYKP